MKNQSKQTQFLPDSSQAYGGTELQQGLTLTSLNSRPRVRLSQSSPLAILSS
jgi:hypothetical protein